MKVAKWGNSLAVRLPKELVETMKLKAGDELEIAPAGDKRLAVSKRERAREFLEAINISTGWRPPATSSTAMKRTSGEGFLRHEPARLRFRHRSQPGQGASERRRV